MRVYKGIAETMTAVPKPKHHRVREKVVKIKLQAEKECWECGQTHSLQNHHCYGGTGNRPISDKYGLTVYLCIEHHLGDTGVEHNKELRDRLQEYAMQEFIKVYSTKLFYQKFRGRF